MSGTIPNQLMSGGEEEQQQQINKDDEDCIDDDDEEDEEDDDDDETSCSTAATISRPATGSRSNTVLGSSSTCVMVALRIRPLLPREVIANARECITVAENDPQVWIAGSHAFTYDHVFNTNVAQDDIFVTVAKPLVDGILDGYNATILAYGQTGSGKTYTMGTGFDPNMVLLNTTSSTPPTTQGILPRCIAYLFELITNATKTTSPPPDFNVSIQFTELYNEEVIDLLSRPQSSSSSMATPRTGQVKIHEQANGQIYLVNITTRSVATASETLEVLKTGALNRTTASTNMNDSSSRSHAIFTINVTQNRVTRDRTGAQDIETLSGKFHFVDLAGSERLKRTLATGERAREGIAINSGLLALGNVISALGDKSKKASHVPYRDSKLTRLLQDSLGGNSRTLMIACVSCNELDFVETLNTMKYANRAKNIKNKVVVNQDKSSRTISLLREEIDRLKSEVFELKRSGGGGTGSGSGAGDYGDVTAENIMLLAEVDTLRSKVKSKGEMCDKLMSQVARLQAVSVVGGNSGGDGDEGGSCDLTAMVTKYLREIEELRGRLYESESECEKLRAKQRVILKNLNNSGGASSLNTSVMEDDVGELIKSARSEVERDKISTARTRCDGDTEEDDDDEGDSEESDDDDENNEDEQQRNKSYAELASITQEINTKQRLIEELENSQLRMESLKLKYEEKLTALSRRIKSAEEERDVFMKQQQQSRGGVSTRSTANAADNKRPEYEAKIASLQAELKKWANAKREHAKVLKSQGSYEAQIGRLRNEIEEMKRVKVRLMNQVRNEATRFRELERVRVKEITQLRKEQRKQEVKVRKLESDGKLKDQVLKRKLEEVEMLKKRGVTANNSVLKGKKGLSPIKGKQVWSRLQANLMKDVSERSNVASLEREMVNLISRRGDLRGELERSRGMGDLDNIESIEMNLRVIDDKIRGVQDEICEVSDGGGQGGSGSGAAVANTSRVGVMMNSTGVRGGGSKWRNMDFAVEADYSYVIDKLYEQAVSSQSEVGFLEAKVKETVEVNKQLKTEVDTLRELLHHMYYSQNSNGIDDITRPPDKYSASLLTMMMPPPPPPPTQSSSSSHLPTKARRRLTNTTSELLGSSCADDDNVAMGTNNPLLNRTFTRNTRLTQSLRGAKSGNVINPARVLKRQDTYLLDNNKEQLNATFVKGNNDDDNGVSTTNNSELTNNVPNKTTSNTTTNVSPPQQQNRLGLLQRSVSEIVVDHHHGEGGRGRGRVVKHTARYHHNNATVTTSSSSQFQSSSWLQLQGNLEGHTKPILCMETTETRLVSGSKDGSCRVWDLETRKEIACFDGHPHNVSAVNYVEDRSILLTASSYQLRVFDLRMGTDAVKVLCSSGTPTPSNLLSQQPIPSLPQSTTLPRVNELPRGECHISFIQRVRNYFFTSMSDRLKIWDIRKLTSIGLLQRKHISNVMCCAGQESGVRNNDWLVSGSKDHSINVYEFESDTPAELIAKTRSLTPLHYDGVECLYLCGNGVLFSGSRDTCIKKWNLNSFEMSSCVNNAHAGWVTGICGVPSTDEFVLSCSRDGVVKMWDCQKDFREVCRFDGSSGGFECIQNNSKCVFFNGGGGAGSGSNNNNGISNNNNDTSSPIGIYKISDSNVIKAASSSVNTNTRGGSGGNSVNSTNIKTQYLNDL